MKRKTIKALLFILIIQIATTYTPKTLMRNTIQHTLLPIHTYSLSNKAKTMSELQEEIHNHIQNRETTFEIVYKGSYKDLTQETINTTIKAALNDSYLRNSLSSWAYETEAILFNTKIAFNISYRTSKEEELIVEQETTKIILDIIKPNMTEFEKVKAINDYIVLTAEYSDNTVASPYSPVSILTEGKGVCLAYSLLAQKLLNKAEIESYIVEGETTEPHAWNLVNIDGEYYHLDTTWNDPLEDRKGLVQYEYFLVPDNILSEDHTWIRENYKPATSNSYSWMHNLRDTTSHGNTINYIDKYGNKRTTTFKTQITKQPDIRPNPIIDQDTQQPQTTKNKEESNIEIQDIQIKSEKQSIISKIANVIRTIFNGFKK